MEGGGDRFSAAQFEEACALVVTISSSTTPQPKPSSSSLSSSSSSSSSMRQGRGGKVSSFVDHGSYVRRKGQRRRKQTTFYNQRSSNFEEEEEEESEDWNSRISKSRKGVPMKRVKKKKNGSSQLQREKLEQLSSSGRPVRNCRVNPNSKYYEEEEEENSELPQFTSNPYYNSSLRSMEYHSHQMNPQTQTQTHNQRLSLNIVPDHQQTNQQPSFTKTSKKRKRKSAKQQHKGKGNKIQGNQELEEEVKSWLSFVVAKNSESSSSSKSSSSNTSPNRITSRDRTKDMSRASDGYDSLLGLCSNSSCMNGNERTVTPSNYMQSSSTQQQQHLSSSFSFLSGNKDTKGTSPNK